MLLLLVCLGLSVITVLEALTGKGYINQGSTSGVRGSGFSGLVFRLVVMFAEVWEFCRKAGPRVAERFWDHHTKAP